MCSPGQTGSDHGSFRGLKRVQLAPGRSSLMTLRWALRGGKGLVACGARDPRLRQHTQRYSQFRLNRFRV
jgi:hypothetical protein